MAVKDTIYKKMNIYFVVREFLLANHWPSTRDSINLTNWSMMSNRNATVRGALE